MAEHCFRKSRNWVCFGICLIQVTLQLLPRPALCSGLGSSPSALTAWAPPGMTFWPGEANLVLRVFDKFNGARSCQMESSYAFMFDYAFFYLLLFFESWYQTLPKICPQALHMPRFSWPLWWRMSTFLLKAPLSTSLDQPAAVSHAIKAHRRGFEAPDICSCHSDFFVPYLTAACLFRSWRTLTTDLCVCPAFYLHHLSRIWLQVGRDWTDKYSVFCFCK